MKVKVDEGTCIGCVLCESNCSDIFKMEDNIAKVIKEDVEGDLAECAKKMVSDCPVGAIVVE